MKDGFWGTGWPMAPSAARDGARRAHSREATTSNRDGAKRDTRASKPVKMIHAAEEMRQNSLGKPFFEAAHKWRVKALSSKASHAFQPARQSTPAVKGGAAVDGDRGACSPIWDRGLVLDPRRTD